MWCSEQRFPINTNCPKRLFDICLEKLTNNINILAKPSERGDLRDHIRLPSFICNLWIERYQIDHCFTNKVAYLFRDRNKTKVTEIRLKNAQITNKGLCYLLPHQPRVIELVNCTFLTSEIIYAIITHGQKLKYLSITPNLCFNKYKMLNSICMNTINSEFNLSSLKLWINNKLLLKSLMRIVPMHNIRYLNLCNISNTVWLPSHLPHLQCLILFNVPLTTLLFDWIRNVSNNITFLNISQEKEDQREIPNPSETLHTLVTSLPNLESLDISNTNLAGSGTEDIFVEINSQILRCDIPGLNSRVNRPLEFLGLYKTHNLACFRNDIPAKKISGDANQTQILLAAEAYFDYPRILVKVLRDIIYFLNIDNITEFDAIIRIALSSLKNYPLDFNIHNLANKILFFTLKKQRIESMPMAVKKTIISLLLDSLEAFNSYNFVRIKILIVIYNFSIPGDLLHEYERTVRVLLDYMICNLLDNSYMLTISVHILNLLSCHGNRIQKGYLGRQRIVNVMLGVISYRLHLCICDDVMEMAWSTLWNVTDQSEHNCRQFLQQDGLDVFLSCCAKFKRNAVLMRNMLGLLGNVAEMRSFRERLMHSTIITVFYHFLNSDNDNDIEMSYNAAGIIAHLASDGADAWRFFHPSRQMVLRRLNEAIHRWNLHSERNVNYHTFLPILNLIRVNHTPICQKWAIWALANVTSVSPEKYCALLVSEGGIRLMKPLLQSSNTHLFTKSLIEIVIANCEKYT